MAVGEPDAHREFVLPMPDGTPVLAQDRYVVVRAPGHGLSRDGGTAFEGWVMADHHGWDAEQRATTRADERPGDLPGVLKAASCR